MNDRFAAVLVAGGNSTRMGTGRCKVLEELGGVPAICHPLKVLCGCKRIDEVCVVCRQEDMDQIARLAAQAGQKAVGRKKICFAKGGAERQESVLRGVQALEGDSGFLLVHDAARPLLNPETLEAVCQGALAFGAATAAVPSKDTCKLADEEGFVASTPERSRLMAVQTPQAFRRDLYLYAVGRAQATGVRYTDDCQLIEAAGGRVKLTAGHYHNFKLTTPEDLLLARALAAKKEAGPMRIGQGYDVHKLVQDRRLVLGGVEVPYRLGLLGHSDADVLAHAITDSLLGAAALGDIGQHFPDNDPAFAGADSLKLLEQVCGLLRDRAYEIGNIDATVIAQRPKLAGYIPAMRENLARACGIGLEQVSVKATTEEGLGFTGRGEGIAASAICMIF